MADNQIRFGVGFDVDTTSLNNLKASLESLNSLGTKDMMKINNSSFADAKAQLEKVRAAAQEVETALQKAFNQKLNTYNLETFKKELKNSKNSLSELYSTFQLAGTTGENAFRSMADTLTRTNVQLKQTHSFLNEITSTLINSAKYTAAYGVINGITDSIKNAYDYVKDLDSSLNDIQIVTQKSSDSMQDFAKQANEAAKALGVSTTTYTDAALTFYQQGLSDEEANARAELSTKVANVTGLSGDEASEYVTAVLNGYKVGSEEAEAAMDILANTGAHTASSLAELSEAMSKVASSANTMGVTEEQLAATLSTVISVTRQDASTVGTAFKTIYARMSAIVAGTDEAEVSLGTYTKKMAAMGINVLDETGKLRDMGEVIEEVGTKWQSMSREQQVYLAQTMAGTRQYNNLMALFENFDQYDSALEYATDSVGTLQTMQDTYMESTAAHLKTLKASWQDAYSSMLDTDTINTVIDAITKLVNVFDSFLDSVGGAVPLIRALASVLLTAFSQRIGASINTTINNMNAMKQNAAELNMALKNVQEFTGIPNLDRDTAKILNMKEALYSLAQNMPQAQFEQLQNEITNFTNATNKVASLTDQVEQLDKALEKTGMGKKAYSLGGLNEDELEKVGTALNKVTTQFNRYKAVSDKINSGIANKTWTYSATTAEKYAATVQKVINSEKLGSVETQRLSEALATYKKEMAEAGDNTEKQEAALRKLTSAMSGSMAREIKNCSSLFEQLTQESTHSAASIKQLLDTAKEEAKNAGTTVENVLQNSAREQIIANFTKLAGAISTVTFGLQSIIDIGDIWTNDELTNGEKAFQIIQKIALAVPMLVSGYKSLVSSLTGAASAQQIYSTAIAMGKTDEEAIAIATAAHEKAQWKLNAAMDANPIGAIILALAALGTAIYATVKIYDYFTMDLEEANEQLDSLQTKMTEFADTAKTYNENINSVKDLADEYEILSEKAGEYDKNIDSLTEDERDRYNTIKDTLVSYNEDLVLYYNDQGEAILKKNDAIQDTIDLLTEEYDLARKSVYNDDFKKNTQAYDTQYNSAKKNVESATGEISETGTRTSISLGSMAEWGTLRGAAENLDATSAAYQDYVDTINNLFNSLESENFDEEYENGNIEKYLNHIKDLLIESGADADTVSSAISSVLTKIGNDIDSASSQFDDLAKAEKELEDLEEIDSSWVLGVMQYNDSYNSKYKSLAKEAGETTTSELLNDYVTGLKLGMTLEDGTVLDSYEDIYAAVSKFEDEILALFSANPDLADDIEKAGEDFSNLVADSFQERVSATMKKIQEFITSNPEFLTMSAEAQQALLQAIFGVTDVTIENGTITGYVDAYTTAIDKIQAAMPEAGDIETQYGDIINDDDLENVDYFIQKLEEAKETTTDYAEAMQMAHDATALFVAVQDANSVGELMQVIAQMAEQGKEIDFEVYSNKLVELAEQYDNTTEAVERYNAAVAAAKTKTTEELSDTYANVQSQMHAELHRGNVTQDEVDKAEAGTYTGKNVALNNYQDEQKKVQAEQEARAAQATQAEQELIMSTRAGELAEQYGLDADALEIYAKQLQKTTKYQNLSATQLVDLAKAATRYQKAIDSATDNMSDWNKELKNANDTTMVSAETYQEVSQAFADLLDMDASDFDLDFIKENYDDFEKVATGADDATEAYNRLEQAALNEIYMTVGIDATDFTSKMDQILGIARDTEGNIISMTADLNDEAVLSALSEMLTAAGLTATQASEVLAKGFSVNAEVQNATEEVPETQAYSLHATTRLAYQDYRPAATDGSTVIQPTRASYPEVTYSTIPVTTTKTIAATGIEVTSAEGKSYGGVDVQNVKVPSSAKKSNTSSGGGGGSSTKKTIDTVSKKDPYHDVNVSINKLSNSYKKLSDAQDNLIGNDLIANLNSQTEILKEQNKLYNEKIKIAKEYAETELKPHLEELGATFDDEGNINNYAALVEAREKELNDAITAYNALSAEEQTDAMKERIDALKDNYEDLLDYIEKYEEAIYDTVEEQEENIRSNLEEMISNQMEAFEVVVNVRLDMYEASKDWNDFTEKVINAVDMTSMLTDDNLDATAARIMDDFKSAFATYASDGSLISDTGIIQAETDQVNSIMAEIDKMKAGEESIYSATDEESGMTVQNWDAAYEDLQEHQKNLEEALEDLVDLEKELEQAFLDSIEAVQDAFDEQQQLVEFLNDETEHQLKMTQLLYGDEAYDQMSKYYDKQVESDQKQLDVLMGEASYWKDLMDKAYADGDNDAFEAYKENWENTITEVNSWIEETIEDVTDQYTNAINEAFQSLNNQLTNGKGLDYVKDELDLLELTSDNYLDTINRAYETQSLQNKWTKAINNTSSLTAQKKLSKLMDEQLTKLNEKAKLSEYDVERAEKEYEIALKEVALEEAQQNKTTMRLQRDSQGNYSYQYVADQDEVLSATQELLDARNELYNFDKDAYEENLNDIIDMTAEMQSKIIEIYSDTTLTREQQEAEVKLIQEQYGQEINDLVEQNLGIRTNLTDSTLDEIEALYGDDVNAFNDATGLELDSFENLTDEEKNLIVNTMVPQWTSGVQTMADKIAGAGGLEEICQDTYDTLDILAEDYRDALEEIGDKSDEVADQVEDEQDILSDAAQEAIDKAEDERDAIEDVRDSVQGLIDDYKEACAAALEAAQAAYDYLQAAREASAASDSNTSTSTTTTITPSTTVSPSNVTITTSTDTTGDAQKQITTTGTPAKTKTTVTYSSVNDSKHNIVQHYSDGSTEIIGTENHTYTGSSPQAGKAGLVRPCSKCGHLTIMRSGHGVYDMTSGTYLTGYSPSSIEDAREWRENEYDSEDSSHYHHSMIAFKTGGYTGEWANSSDGKLAVLHQKELVLNSEDTQNILFAVDTMRAITAAIGSSTLQDMAKNINSANFSAATNETLDQNVYITATFEGQTEADQIQTALNNLVNIAAQRAHSTRR